MFIHSVEYLPNNWHRSCLMNVHSFSGIVAQRIALSRHSINVGGIHVGKMELYSFNKILQSHKYCVLLPGLYKVNQPLLQCSQLVLVNKPWQLFSKHAAFHECPIITMVMLNNTQTPNKQQGSEAYELIQKSTKDLSSQRQKQLNNPPYVCPEISFTIVLADHRYVRP